MAPQPQRHLRRQRNRSLLSIGRRNPFATRCATTAWENDVNFDDNFIPRSRRGVPQSQVDVVGPDAPPQRFEMSPELTPDQQLDEILRKLVDSL